MRKPAGGWNMPLSAAGYASGPRAVRSRAARSTRACTKASTSTSCTSNIDRLGPTACEQIGGDQGGIVPALLPNAGDQGVGGRIGQLVEPALERGGGRLGVEPGGADALVTEKALQVGNVHSERKQACRHGVAQQVRVDALADSGPHRNGANDLADALARQHMRHRAGASLTAGEQRPGSPGADMEPEQLGQLAPDRHFPPFVTFAVADGDD